MSTDGAGTSDPRGKSVLIVDDDADIRMYLRFIIKGAGFQVLEGETGEDAIRKLAERPDAIVTDLIMPGCGGLGLLRHLKTLPGPVPPVIVITAYEKRHPDVNSAIMDPNVVQCLSKPLNDNVLIGALHRYLKTEPLGG
ncbi:MAG: response regulator [Elusimicrobia bacterium]|nr:response regulator [Elusimicrobiota bacterium]